MDKQEIKTLRESLDLNKTQFAKKLKVTPKCVSLWEKGERTPRGRSLIDLEELFKSVGSGKMIIEYQVTNICTDLSLVPEGAEILAIDGVECIGTCESCNSPVLEADIIHRDGNGIIICPKCWRDFLREQ